MLNSFIETTMEKHAVHITREPNSARPSALIAEAPGAGLLSFQGTLEKNGRKTGYADSTDAVLKLLEENEFSVALVGVGEDYQTAFNLIDTVQRHSPHTAVLAAARFSPNSSSLTSVLSCADDYLFFPFRFEELEMRLDLTALKGSRQKQKRIERVENALQSIAGGLAHRFNNLLCGITGNAHLIRLACGGDEKISGYLQPLLESAQGMNRLTNRLGAFAGNWKSMPQRAPINYLIEAALKQCHADIPSHIAVSKDLLPDPPEVRADLRRMCSAVSDIILNAVESIRKNGRIYLKTSIEYPPAPMPPGSETPKFGCITIQDDGIGMPFHMQEKIFDPFFTTKFYGRGLGMAAAYGVVKDHGGWIGVKSTPEKGASVQVYLPIASASQVQRRFPAEH